MRLADSQLHSWLLIKNNLCSLHTVQEDLSSMQQGSLLGTIYSYFAG